MTTKPRHRLTLKDRLSRLTFTQACKHLGDEGRHLKSRWHWTLAPVFTARTGTSAQAANPNI